MSEHRGLNSRLQGDRILELDPINIGVAIETEHSLLVLVIKSADSLGIEEVSEELVRLRQAIAAGSITADDLTGGTFTVINLGLFGVGAFTPILNPLEIGILGIGRIRPQASVNSETREVEVRDTMVLSLSFDHRVVDGAPATRFLETVAELMEGRQSIFDAHGNGL